MTDNEHLFTDEEISLIFTKLGELMDALGMLDEELSSTEIKDKDGVVHDLSELVKSECVIDTGIARHMAIHDFYTLTNRWTSSGGVSHSSESLANFIREHADDPDVKITVHKF